MACRHRPLKRKPQHALTYPLTISNMVLVIYPFKFPIKSERSPIADPILMANQFAAWSRVSLRPHFVAFWPLCLCLCRICSLSIRRMRSTLMTQSAHTIQHAHIRRRRRDTTSTNLAANKMP